jgi:hypothetical protein
MLSSLWTCKRSAAVLAKRLVLTIWLGACLALGPPKQPPKEPPPLLSALRLRNSTQILTPLKPAPLCTRSLQELRVFLEVEGELETAFVWTSLLPAPPPGLVEGTARLSKQVGAPTGGEKKKKCTEPCPLPKQGL